ncbi:inhibitor of Bruton tyrosine kinase-like [Daphnia carinata]|uniref:inhibitor of Bruton tyrosine kinase-like n=1 Tax=Daphnia carinata TaxID=120202 RepID=UPI00257D1734|nr:inhibitor of Bruton tyrosine kinase-like [Daphnia carinata]XP_057374419.1 inhibitor of Bruton tyrosine kinase-like [Daphnia carinata]
MWEECTTKCCSRKHADNIFSAILAGNQYEEMAVKLLPTCSNIATNKDSFGRTGLQIAASFGRMKILLWLCSHEAHIHSKDEESGYSALHRSFYFGQLQAGRALLQNNASLFQPLDNDNMSPFDHLIQDRSDFEAHDPKHPCEAYVWGSNCNFGLGKQLSPEAPELLDAFPKGSGGIKQVTMNKFHSVFVTTSGQAFSCGIGQGGKLGLGSEATVIIPQKISLEAENCINNRTKKSTVILEAALGTHHTILLTETGNVLSFGVNTYHQLGHNPPPSQLVTPKVLSRFEDKSNGVTIKGICASRYHSVFWCSNNVYTCGLNAGALGHNKGEKTITTPKRVPLLSEQVPTVTHVAASDGATAIATASGHVYVLHEYQCRKIASKQYDLAKIVMSGGKLDFSQEDLVVENIAFQVLLLTKSGKVFVWSQTNPVLTRCTFRGSPFCIMKDIALFKNSLAFVNREGEAFVGAIANTSPGKRKVEAQSTVEQISTRIEFLKREQFVQIHIQRIPGIHRATSIACDPTGKNFAVTQIKPTAPMQNIAQVRVLSSQLKEDLKQLFLDADWFDRIHDIVFDVGSKKFAAHRFILAVNCSAFYQKVCGSSRSLESDNRTFHITDVPAEVFGLILEFIYTGTCAIFEKDIAAWNLSFLHSKECMHQYISTGNDPNMAHQKIINDGENADDRGGPWRLLRTVQFHAKNLGVRKLAEILEKAHIANSGVVRNDHFLLQPKQWNRLSGETFYDVKLFSVDGKEFNAHRVVLAARSDYFRSMFSYVWLESEISKEIRLPIHSVILEVILEYLYEDKASKIEKSEDVDWIGNCLVSADLLLIPRLVSICESSLAGLLAIKNVAKMLEFATMYNAVQLKVSCMYFMCYNLPAVVELRIWNCLDEEVMKNLTDFYHQFNPRVRSRVPTPTMHKKLTEDNFDIHSITESFADVTLSSFKREPEAKKKKLRKKSGKKGVEVKDHHQPPVESTELTSNIKPIVDNAASLKKEGWLKVDKSKKRNKSLNQETLPAEPTPSSSPPKSQIPDKSNTMLGVRSKEFAGNIKGSPNSTERTRAFSSSESGGTPEKQNNLTLFEMATTVFQTATNSPENEKNKKFRKLSQKQRKLQETHAVAATANGSPWKSLDSFVGTNGKEIICGSAENEKSAAHSEDSLKTPTKIQSVWGSPEKTNNISKSEVPEGEENSLPLQRIIAKEKLQRKNLIKISTKPLRLTLIEEKAIEELAKFYGADQIDDEFIVVERILPLAPAVPIWSSGKDNKSTKQKPKFRSFSMSESGI